MNPTIRGIAYVSVWVVIWGTVASLMDWMLLVGDVYESGTSGQAVTFVVYAAATVVMATRFASRFLGDPSSDAADRVETPISRDSHSKARFTRRLPFLERPMGPEVPAQK